MTTDAKHTWYQKGINEALTILHTTSDGLNSDAVADRRALHGLNKIESTYKIRPWVIFLEQFKDFLIIILLIATVVSFFLGERLDGIVILVIVVLCAILGFLQEYRSEKAVEALKRLASPNATVIRDGEEHIIPAEELVPGDIVILQTGDLIPADARIIESFNLSIDESILTGESTQVNKISDPLSANDVPIGDQRNMLFASSIVTYGRGRAVVTSTGMNTEFGRIAGMLQEIKSEKTPLEKQMEIIGRWLGIICIGVCCIASLLGVLRGHPLVEMFIWGVSLAVAAVPEALPAVVTSALAIGVQRMAKEHAIVKRLSAVETLGCTTVICSDKTGTLTRNEMTVKEIYIPGRRFHITGSGYEPKGQFFEGDTPVQPETEPGIKSLIELAVLCNDSRLQMKDETWMVLGDPTEGALVVAGVKSGANIKALRDRYPRIGEVPFEEVRKMMSTLHIKENGKNILIATKGAPEAVIERCTHYQSGNFIHQMTDEEKKSILTANEEMAKGALRVLAVAWRELLKGDDVVIDHTIEHNLIFCGLSGMIDPPREEVKASVMECRKAGIRPVMVTGDHLLTARAIAEGIGIMDPYNPGHKVLSGSDLDKMSDDDIDKVCLDVRVFARVSPEHKLRIVDAYKRKGEVVAMTGDGVNDAPALKRSDIGVAMGIKGTDVSREAADMVLADDNFATIVRAVREGRAAYENIKKYLIFLLSCNIGEILILTGAFFFGLPIPLIALQILWVNLTTDGLPALALGVDPADPDIMDYPPRGKDSSVFTSKIVGLIFIVALHIFIVLFAIFYSNLATLDLEKAQTMVFVTMILLEMFNAFNCRSIKDSIIKRTPWQNRWLLPAVASSLALSIFVVHVPFMNTLFHTRPLALSDWIVAILASSTIVFSVEVIKMFWRRRTSGLKSAECAR